VTLVVALSAAALACVEAQSMEFFNNDFYGALELRFDDRPSAAEIKTKYRSLSKKFHPDRNRGDAASAKRMQAINRAYEVLYDPVSRAEYDSFIYSLPSSWRPMFGKERKFTELYKPHPALVVVVCVLGFVYLVSKLQLSQYRREREQALNSELFRELLEAAKKGGQTEENFLAEFLDANPELERTWDNTLAGHLKMGIIGIFVKRRGIETEVDKKIVQAIEIDKKKKEEEERREREHELHKRRLVSQGHEKQARKKRANRRKELERLRAITERRRQILLKHFDIRFLLLLLRHGEDFLAPRWAIREGDTEDDLKTRLDEFKEDLLKLLESDELDKDAFWEGCFDHAFHEIEMIHLQELEREEQATRTWNGNGIEKEETEDAEDWGKELDEKERLKARKRAAAKKAKKNKAAENKKVNEERKKITQKKKQK